MEFIKGYGRLRPRGHSFAVLRGKPSCSAAARRLGISRRRDHRSPRSGLSPALSQRQGSSHGSDHRRAWPRDRERRPDSSGDGQVFLEMLLREIDPVLHRGDGDGQTVGWARFRIAWRDLEPVLDHAFRAPRSR